MGHLMRNLAIAEAAIGLGWSVRIGGDLSPEASRLLSRLVPDADVETMPLPRVKAWLRSVAGDRPEVIHLDSYLPESDVVAAASLLSNMQDGVHGARRADLAVDGNLGAETRPVSGTAARHLLGVRYMPIRQQVLRQRAVEPVRSGPFRLLVVLGGTDPFGVTEQVVAALRAIRAPADVTVVTPESHRDRVVAAAMGQRHRFRFVAFLEDLPATARSHDLVISAAGTSIWDFACMGVPAALLCVVDNQREGYEAMARSGLGIGLGTPPFDDLEGRIADLQETLDRPGRLEQIVVRGRETVDGQGALRIVSAWAETVAGCS